MPFMFYFTRNTQNIFAEMDEYFADLKNMADQHADQEVLCLNVWYFRLTGLQ